VRTVQIDRSQEPKPSLPFIDALMSENQKHERRHAANRQAITDQQPYRLLMPESVG